jgi:hypothetical protein
VTDPLFPNQGVGSFLDVSTMMIYTHVLSRDFMIDRRISSSFGAQGFRFEPGTIPGLIGFDVGWTRDDHHVSWLSIGPNTTSPLDSGDYLVALRDQDSSGHPISGRIKFEDLRDVARHREASSGSVRGEQRLRIPHLSSAEEFVLTGFLFEYESSDHHLLHIKLLQMAHNDHIHVNFGDAGGAERYRVSIKYAVLPSSMLARSTVYMESGSPVRSEDRISRTAGTALLQSFEFRFQNGDHHLQRISLDLDEDEVLVRFRDQDGNDPFTWMTEFAVLRT